MNLLLGGGPALPSARPTAPRKDGRKWLLLDGLDLKLRAAALRLDRRAL